MLHAALPAAIPLTLAPGVALARGRAHEIAGPARRTLALLLASLTHGPGLWLAPTAGSERLMGDGVAELLDPARLIFGTGRNATELLWAAEEAARAGAVAFVVVELDRPPGLTPVRRLHLAAEAGAARGAPALILLLTPDDGGAAGVETRWRADTAPGWAFDGTPRWRIARLRARVEPPAAWDLRLTPRGPALAPLSDAPEPETPL